MDKIVVIDTEECIGCESCVEICPEVFGFNEAEEKAEVIMPEDGPEDCIEDAMDTCPVECIHYIEQNGVYTAFHKNIPAGISGCKKKRLNNGTFF